MVTPESQVEFVLLKQRSDKVFANFLAARLATVRRDNPSIASCSDEELLALPISAGGTPLGELLLSKWNARNDEQPHAVS